MEEVNLSQKRLKTKIREFSKCNVFLGFDKTIKYLSCSFYLFLQCSVRNQAYLYIDRQIEQNTVIVFTCFSSVLLGTQILDNRYLQMNRYRQRDRFNEQNIVEKIFLDVVNFSRGNFIFLIRGALLPFPKIVENLSRTYLKLKSKREPYWFIGL